MAKEEFTRDLFNKGQRTISLSRTDAEGVVKQLDFAPQKSIKFTEQEATYLLRLYAPELIDMNNVSVDSLVSGNAAAAVAAQTRAQEAEIAKRLEDARLLKKQKAYDEAIKEGFDEAEARSIAGLPPLPKAEGEEEAKA